MPNKLDTESIYFDEHYFREYTDFSEDNYRKRLLSYRQELKRLQPYIPSGGRLLDIGCGVGAFTELFGSEWEKFGIEVSDYARNIAAQRGIRFDLESCEEESFDLIVFRGTIHYMDHADRVTYAHKLLKKGGVLAFLATPNTASLYYKFFKSLPMLEENIEHNLTSDNQLRKLVEKIGFQVHRVNKPYLTTPYARPMKDMAYFVANLFGAKRKFAFYGNMFELIARKQ